MRVLAPMRHFTLLLAAPLFLAGCGSSNSTMSTQTSNTPAAFVYTASEVTSTISGFSVNATTGVLTAIPGMPIAAAGNLSLVATDPKGQFLVSNENPGIAVYSIDQTTGLPHAIASAAVTTSTVVSSLAFDPAGKYLFAYTLKVSDWDPPGPGATPPNPNPINVFALNRTTGALTPVPGSPFSILSPKCVGCFLAVSVTGRSLFVMDEYLLDSYSVDPASGTLTLVNSVAGPGSFFPGWIAVDPGGAYVYQADSHGNLIHGYAIDPVTGALSAGPDSHVLGASATALILDPRGGFAYTSENAVLDAADTSIGAYSVSNGKFTSIGSISTGMMGVDAIQFGASAASLIVAEDNSYLVGSVGSTSQLAVFGRDTGSGKLSTTPQGTFSTGQWPTSLAVAPAP